MSPVELPFTIVDVPTGFEVHIDPKIAAEALAKIGWTVWPPVSAEEALAIMAHVKAPASLPQQAAEVPVFRVGSQLHRLLDAYASTVKTGLTDEDAATDAGLLGSCYWKRASELRRYALIAPVLNNGKPVTRKGSAGTPRRVCVITAAGRNYLQNPLSSIKGASSADWPPQQE
jgi:hypothetical protein